MSEKFVMEKCVERIFGGEVRHHPFYFKLSMAAWCRQADIRLTSQL